MRPCTTRAQRPRSSGWRSSPGAAGGIGSAIGERLVAEVRGRHLRPRAGGGLRRCTRSSTSSNASAVGAFVARVEAELGPVGRRRDGRRRAAHGRERGGRRGGLPARDRRQPHRHLERDPGRAAGDARARQRADRDDLVGDRPRRARALRRLRRVQGRRDRAHQGAGARAGAARHAASTASRRARSRPACCCTRRPTATSGWPPTCRSGAGASRERRRGDGGVPGRATRAATSSGQVLSPNGGTVI